MYRLLATRVCLPARNGLVLLSAWIQVFYRILLNRKINVTLLTNILTNQEDTQTVRTPPPLPKKKKERKEKKNSRDISVAKDVTSKILPYDFMNLFINGVPRGLDRQKQQLYARAAHFFQRLFADDEKIPNVTFYGGQHKTTTDGSSLHLTRSVSWNSRDKD